MEKNTETTIMAYIGFGKQHHFCRAIKISLGVRALRRNSNAVLGVLGSLQVGICAGEGLLGSRRVMKGICLEDGGRSISQIK